MNTDRLEPATGVPKPLVGPAWLAEHLDVPNLRILDATVRVEFDSGTGRASVKSGRGLWEQGHVPNSDHVDLIELSDKESPLSGTVPSADQFAAAISGHGVGPGTHVISYDVGLGMYATRLWWMLRLFGLDSVSVLDGGWAAWQAAGHRVSTDPAPEHPATTFEPAFRSELLAETGDVEARVADRSGCLINALSPELFRGEGSAGYRRPGRIPGSINLPSYDFMDHSTQRFLPVDRVRRYVRDHGVLDESRPLVAYCGAGVAATMTAFGLALAGREDVAVYDGSLEAWTADPDRPVEVG